MTLGYQCLTTKVSAVTEAHGRGNPREIFDRHWEFLAIGHRRMLVVLPQSPYRDTGFGQRIRAADRRRPAVNQERIPDVHCETMVQY